MAPSESSVYCSPGAYTTRLLLRGQCYRTEGWTAWECWTLDAVVVVPCPHRVNDDDDFSIYRPAGWRRQQGFDNGPLLYLVVAQSMELIFFTHFSGSSEQNYWILWEKRKIRLVAVETPHCTMTPGCTNCMTEEKLLFRKIVSDRLSTEQGYTQAKSADYLLAVVNLNFFQV